MAKTSGFSGLAESVRNFVSEMEYSKETNHKASIAMLLAGATLTYLGISTDSPLVLGSSGLLLGSAVRPYVEFGIHYLL